MDIKAGMMVSWLESAPTADGIDTVQRWGTIAQVVTHDVNTYAAINGTNGVEYFVDSFKLFLPLAVVP